MMLHYIPIKSNFKYLANASHNNTIYEHLKDISLSMLEKPSFSKDFRNTQF